MALIICPKCGNKVQDGYIRERSMCPYCGISANEVFRAIEHDAKEAPAQESTSQAKATPNQESVCGKNYTCPECGAELTQEQLSDNNMCPECGCPASNIRAAAEAEQAKEQRERVIHEAQKEANAKAKLPKTPDDRYKTTASKLLSAFAWIIWVCGAIDVIAIAISASRLRYSYYSTGTTGTTLFFAAVAVAAASMFFGGVLYGASKLLIDIHATRVNLEMLNENKEG